MSTASRPLTCGKPRLTRSSPSTDGEDAVEVAGEAGCARRRQGGYEAPARVTGDRFGHRAWPDLAQEIRAEVEREGGRDVADVEQQGRGALGAADRDVRQRTLPAPRQVCQPQDVVLEGRGPLVGDGKKVRDDGVGKSAERARLKQSYERAELRVERVILWSHVRKLRRG